MDKQALIAMSGGVDSSVAAYLSQQEYTCIGATMRLCANSLFAQEQDSSCCGIDDVQDARNVANRLGIPFYAINATEQFQSAVVDDFVATYEAGLTPNPCIRCNQHLKFGYLLQKALELGCEYVVTGHYARIRQDSQSGRFLLYKALDSAKDQSYFLACLTQHQLAHIRFPLGELTKEQVRQIALEQGFLNARKKDSQDICFIPDGDYAAFLRRYTKKDYPTGDFLDTSGKVVGRHSGAVDYTLGQRKGLGLAMGAPVYVCAKDMEKNTVTVGPDPILYRQALRANDWHWFAFEELKEPMTVTAKARSRHTAQPATVYPEENGFARVVFHEPQRALTPGQAVVLYQDDMVVGGGTITEIL